jgi:hypothetical protein
MTRSSNINTYGIVGISGLLLVAGTMGARAQAPSGAPPNATAAKSYTGAASTDAGANLKSNFVRDAIQHDGDRVAEARPIGRLTLHLDGDDGSRTVPVSYPFRSGDRLHFEVSTNRDSWLYVLHQGPDGKIKHLWPMPVDDTSTSTINRLHEHATVLVPSVGVFALDEETGNEHFYFVLCSERGWPDLADAAPLPSLSKLTRVMTGSRKAKRQTTSASSPTNPTPENFRVRGLIYVPPSSENDRSLYFGPAASSQTNQAILEFQLTHRP